MDYQRIRNLTTRRLHTDVSHIYQDIAHLVGVPGVMTHQIPGALRALEWWLRGKLADQRFWDGLHDPLHAGEQEIEPMTAKEQRDFFTRLTRQR